MNYFFFRRCDLLEFPVEFLPYVVSWIPLLALMHVIFNLGSSILATGDPMSAICPFYKVQQELLGLPTSSVHSQWIPRIRYLRINEVTSSQSFCIIELRSFHLSNLRFSFVLEFFDILLHISVKKWSDLDVTCRSVSRPSFHMYLSGEFSLMTCSKLSENCLRKSQKSIDPSIVPIIIDAIFLHNVWVSMETSIHFSGIGNDSTLDIQSLTLETTWWPHMKSPEINQK